MRRPYSLRSFDAVENNMHRVIADLRREKAERVQKVIVLEEKLEKLRKTVRNMEPSDEEETT